VTPINDANATVAVDNWKREGIEKYGADCRSALLYFISVEKSFFFKAVALQGITRYSTDSAYGGAGIYLLEVGHNSAPTDDCEDLWAPPQLFLAAESCQQY